MTPIDIDPAWLTQLLTAVGVLITAIVGILNVWLARATKAKVDESAIELKALKMRQDIQDAGVAKRPPPPARQRAFKKA